MRIDPKDGCCRTCGGPLEITGADDAARFVVCPHCRDEYVAEISGDGAMTYYVDFLTGREGNQE